MRFFILFPENASYASAPKVLPAGAAARPAGRQAIEPTLAAIVAGVSVMPPPQGSLPALGICQSISPSRGLGTEK